MAARDHDERLGAQEPASEDEETDDAFASAVLAQALYVGWRIRWLGIDDSVLLTLRFHFLFTDRSAQSD